MLSLFWATCWLLLLTCCTANEDPEFSLKRQLVDELTPYSTSHWAIKLAVGTDPYEIARRHGHEYVGTVGDLDGYHLFRKKDDTIHGETHPHHHESMEIHWSEEQFATPRNKRADLPTDPLYRNQWHLHLLSTATNVHVNVEPVWRTLNITGQGHTIAVTDDGLDYTHQDIAPNYRANSSWDFNQNRPNPFPDGGEDTHGTPAAGVAAARDNGVCGVGTAFRAGVAGLRILASWPSDALEGGALGYKLQDNHIFSNSWGPTDDGMRKEGPGKLTTIALEKGMREGRGGKGTIYIWAAGNGRNSGDNCNYDGYVNKRYTVSIPAVDYKGGQTYYSEDCAMHVVSAPSSGNSYAISSTARRASCTSSFGGTSAAAPMVAGISALILEVNDNLTWRDMISVFIETANRNDRQDPGWKKNGAGYFYNHKYGFGIVDAYEAVKKAKTWVNLPAEISYSVGRNDSQNFMEGAFISSQLEVTREFTVEHAAVRFVAAHSKRGDLVIDLVSPHGTVSHLAEVHRDTGRNYDWVFGSIVNWGERSNGTWTLNVKDGVQGNTGNMVFWELTLYGHPLPEVEDKP